MGKRGKHWEKLAGSVEEKVKYSGVDVVSHQLGLLSEEVGELHAAYRSWDGRARKFGTWYDVEQEMADVYITLRVLAEMLDIDLKEVVNDKMEKIEERGGL